MKLTADQPYADPEKAARKILEIANSVEAIQDGRIRIEKINGPFLYREGGHAGRIQGWPGSGDRPRLAGAARERNVREVHAGGRRTVCLRYFDLVNGSDNWHRPTGRLYCLICLASRPGCDNFDE